jgi:ribosome-binding factor A
MGSGKNRPTRRAMREVCGEVGPDDGVDPRELARARMRQHRTTRPGPGPGPSERGAGRKARQLGRQVAESLDAVLAGDSRDELLRSLRVVAVTPAPDASRLLVTVAPRPAAGPLDPSEALARLERASGWLRTEAAAAITRKRAPNLSFHLIPVDPDTLKDAAR